MCLISTISKIAEAVMMEQLVDHMNMHRLWNRDQHAYRSGFSTVTALLTLHEDWLEQMDHNLQNILVSLDMFAAFNTVKHKILIYKL